MKIALYPGTFDPITNGHLDVLHRASIFFDKVIVSVAENDPKTPLFPIEERVRLIRENVDSARIEVRILEGLVVEFAKKVGAHSLIRGLRAISDFEYEFQMAQMNRNLDESIETIFLMPNEKFFYTSSKLIKQVARYTGRETRLVPPNVQEALRKKFGHPPSNIRS
ncbi:MAG: pantetheine-phosphate adenylyltransferase [Puniceicoccaceae bacterium]